MRTETKLDIIWGADEIAKAIGRTTRQVNHLLSLGALPAKKVGGRWCVSLDALNAFFSSVSEAA